MDLRDLRPGVRIDRYTLVEPLGRGGQGSVWKVVDPLDGVVRALKLIRLQGLDAGTVERARREARAVAGVAHPALVPCRALFEELNAGLLGLVFDYVPGQSLLAAARDPRLLAAHREAALRQLAEALAYVHGLGLVHRDLKPENVQITDAFWAAPASPGGVRLLDFGIVAPADNRKGITAPGMVVGTRAYLAPEMLAPGLWLPLPEGYSRDLFAFGVLAWELCCGGHPTGLEVDASSDAFVDTYRACDAGARPWPPPGLAGALDAAVRACLQIDPRRRPANGAALLELLGPPPTVVNSGPPTALGGVGVDVTAPTALNAVQGAGAYAPTMEAPSTPAVHAAAPPSAGVTLQSAGAAPAHTPAPYVPMPVQPAPAGAPAQAPRSAPGPGRILALALLAIVVVGAVVGVIAVRRMERKRTKTPAETAQPAASSPPSAEPAAEPAAPVPCCPPAPIRCVRPDMACNSTKGCTETLLPERSWWLRPTAVAGRGSGDFSENLFSRPGAELCLELGEALSCAPLRQAVNDRVGLPVRTSDILQGNLKVRVNDAAGVIADDRTAPIQDGLKSSALCRGLLLYVGPKDRAPVRLTLELREER